MQRSRRHSRLGYGTDAEEPNKEYRVIHSTLSCYLSGSFRVMNTGSRIDRASFASWLHHLLSITSDTYTLTDPPCYKNVKIK